MKNLPAFLQDMIANPPQAGAGVHKWMFNVSRQLHAHWPASEIVRSLQDKLANCGRHVPQREIIAAVQDALPCAWAPSGNAPIAKPVPKWPTINHEQREAIVSNGQGLADLWEVSPVRMEDEDAHTEEIIDRLFPGNPLLCCGASSSTFATEPRENWRGALAAIPLIVPSPMTAPTGLTKDGRESAHALSNTGPRRFLVVEFDEGTTDEHAALLMHLADFGPLVCAVHSGGKSLHGWFYCRRGDDEKVSRFFRYAVSLGADPATWTRSQFVRMPDGRRENGNRQTVFFLNLKPLEAQ